jgi:hypothetical protein
LYFLLIAAIVSICATLGISFFVDKFGFFEIVSLIFIAIIIFDLVLRTLQFTLLKKIKVDTRKFGNCFYEVPSFRSLFDILLLVPKPEKISAWQLWMYFVSGLMALGYGLARLFFFNH